MITHTEPVMGTIVSFSIGADGADPNETREALASACRVLHRADAIFSTYRPGSAISRLRNGETIDPAERAPELEVVADLCRRARSASAGWFDPWQMPGGYDPTGLVKGWAGAAALEELRRRGIPTAMVNAAGDISAYGRPPDATGPWRVGISAPDASGAIAWSLDVDAAISTSGPTQRGPHIIDPFLGESTESVRSATVVGPSGAITDALATALAAGGSHAAEAIARFSGYEALWLEAGTWRATPGFPPVTRHADERTLIALSPRT